MKNNKPPPGPSRRRFLRLGLLSGAGLAGASAILSKLSPALASESFSESSFGAMCEAVTPTQIKGPFYPVSHQLDEDNDLSFIQGHQNAALGQIVYIQGTVTDAKTCLPLAGVLVEIWQACASGRYNHPNDTNPAPVDLNFQYFGKTVTAANGRYLFRTIIPGAYPADVDWMRPPHVHFRVVKKGFKELVTQMYFAGDTLNEKDAILQALTPSEQNEVVVNLSPADPIHFGPDAKIGEFGISIQAAR